MKAKCPGPGFVRWNGGWAKNLKVMKNGSLRAKDKKREVVWILDAIKIPETKFTFSLKLNGFRRRRSVAPSR